jgi:transglutaminase-like putative cysteine protease
LSQARALIRTLQAVDPVNPGRLIEEADLVRRAGDLEGARRLLQEAARRDPEWPRPWEKLGDLAYERGSRAEALAAWKRAHERDPNNATLASHIEFLEPTRLGYIEKFVPTEADIDAAMQQKFTTHGSAQVAILLDHEVTEVNGDGSSRRVVTLVQQAADERGRDNLTHERIGTGRLKILKAYALHPNGERQEASSIRGGEVRFRNLQVGSKTVLQYVHYLAPAHFLPNAFASHWFFQSLMRQHLDSTWVLVLPRGRTLHVEVTGPVEEKRLAEEDRDVRIYHAAKLPPLLHEPGMAPADDLLAQVAVSTVESWDDYVRWERALLGDAFHTNPSLDALTDKLLADAKSPREKLDKLYQHVVEEVRYQQDYETTVAGVRPHSAPSVIERGYGDCKDKAVLLIQMARRAGLALHFAILRTTPHGRVRKEIPNQQFNHAIVYVPEQPGIEHGFFMDPTSDGLDLGNLRPDDQGALALVMDPDSGKWQWRPIPYQSPDADYDHHKVRIEVKSPTEAQISDEISLRGGLAMGLRHVLRNQGEARKLLESLTAALFPGATMRDGKAGGREDIRHPLTVSLDVDGSQSIRAEDDHYRLAMPGIFHLANQVTLARRETPLRLGAPASFAYDIETTLPDGFQVMHAPKDFAVEHACFTLSRRARVEARRLTVHLEYARRCTDVAAADYAPFREAVQKASQKLQDDLTWGHVQPLKQK